MCAERDYADCEQKSPEEVGCIILHPLETAYYSYRQHYGANAVEGAINEYV